MIEICACEPYRADIIGTQCTHAHRHQRHTSRDRERTTLHIGFYGKYSRCNAPIRCAHKAPTDICGLMHIHIPPGCAGECYEWVFHFGCVRFCFYLPIQEALRRRMVCGPLAGRFSKAAAARAHPQISSPIRLPASASSPHSLAVSL